MIGRPARRELRSPASRDRGAVLPIVALTLPVLILMTAFAVDLGRQRALRRDLQASADVLALDLSRVIGDEPAAPDDTVTLGALNASLARNGMATVTSIDGTDGALVQWGRWTPTPAGTDCPRAIVTEPPTCFSVGATPVNAVRVTLDDEIDYFFQTGSGSARRSAVATRAPTTGVQVGSVAAGLRATLPGAQATVDATVSALNARLGASFGATVPPPGAVGLDAGSYEGLASSDVDLWRIAQAGGFASPNELLAQDLTVAELLGFTATALDQQAAEGDPNAAAAAASVRQLGTSVDSAVGLDATNTIRLDDAFEFAQGGDDAAATGSVNVLDLLSAGAEALNGKHFLQYEFDPGVPGVASVGVEQFLVQGSQTRWGGVGTTATNKQMGFQLTLDVAPLLGMSGPVTVPFIVDAATATGEVTRIDCVSPPDDSEVDVSVDTSVLDVRVGTASNIATGTLTAQAGVIVEAGDLTVSALLQLGFSLLDAVLGSDLRAEGAATLAGANDQLLTFRPLDDPNPHQRAQGGIGATSLGAQLTSSLRARYGLGLLSSTISANLASQLDYVFANVDDLIVGPLLTATGLSIGGADVLAFDLECGSPMLVE